MNQTVSTPPAPPLPLLPITIIGGVSFWVVIGLVFANLGQRRQRRYQDAEQTWKAIRLRNGVGEPSPWHDADHPINAPGVMQCTYPHSQPPLHPWECEPVPSPPQPTSDTSADASPPSEKPTESDFSDEISPEKRQLLENLVAQGERRKTHLAKQVFGVSSGAKYQKVSPIISEVLSHAQ